VSSGLCGLWWRNQNLVERSHRLELIKFGFEAQDGMAATWGVGTCLVWSLSAFLALLVGLFTLPVYPIVGALLVNRRDGLTALCRRGFVRNDRIQE
jgi:hypothetical protein